MRWKSPEQKGRGLALASKDLTRATSESVFRVQLELEALAFAVDDALNRLPWKSAVDAVQAQLLRESRSIDTTQSQATQANIFSRLGGQLTNLVLHGGESANDAAERHLHHLWETSFGREALNAVVLLQKLHLEAGVFVETMQQAMGPSRGQLATPIYVPRWKVFRSLLQKVMTQLDNAVVLLLEMHLKKFMRAGMPSVGITPPSEYAQHAVNQWHASGVDSLFFSRAQTPRQPADAGPVAHAALRHFENILLQLWSTAKAGRLQGVRVELLEELAVGVAEDLGALQNQLGEVAGYDHNNNGRCVSAARPLVDSDALIEIGNLIELLEVNSDFHTRLLRCDEDVPRVEAREWLGAMRSLKLRAGTLLTSAQNSPNSANTQKINILAKDIYSRTEKCEVDCTRFLVKGWETTV